MKMYGIFDRAISAYTGPPFFQPTNAAAMRTVKMEATREGSQLNATPTDFELWHLADFNEQTGQVSGSPERIARIEDLIGSQE